MELQPGSTLGRYQIVDCLGAGGMAVVYRAYHPALDRVVALKVIRPELTDEPEFVERFSSEAKAVARLRHPHVVQVHDFDVADGRHFIVMDHIEGGPLDERLADLRDRGKWVTPQQAARIVSEIADGLGYAHESGILHRDVKPANVLLTRDGRAVVSDFGLARLVTSVGRTRTGTWVGTPEYMSPEQSRGAPVDARSDVYSLAVVAYELFTGRRPYEGDTPLAVALARMNEPLRPPREIAPSIGVATEQVIVRALALDPDARFQSARELAAALSSAVAADGSDAVPAPAPAAVSPAPQRPTHVTTISISMPTSRTGALVLAGALVVAAVGGVVGGRALLAGSAAPTAAPVAGPPLGPAGAAPGGLDLRGLALAQLPRGTLVFERSGNFRQEDLMLGPRTAASSVAIQNGTVRLAGDDPPAEIGLRGTGRPVYIAEHVVFIDPANDVRLEICVRMTTTFERYCFAMTRAATEFQYWSRDRVESVAKGPPVVPWAGDKTLTVFAQMATFTLYADDRIVLEAQDSRIRQGDLEIGVGASRSGSSAGAATLKSFRQWTLLPPR